MFSIIILTGILLISVINNMTSNLGGLYCFLITIILTIAVVVVDAVFAFIIRRLPNKWFDEKVKMHYASRKELKFYEKLGVRTWKDKVPELGGFTSFHKDKIRDGDNPAYLKRFILECNYGAMIHLVTAILGFLIVFITPLNIWYRFALPVGLFNFFLNLMPYAILRYNVPRLKSLLKLAIRKSNKS